MFSFCSKILKIGNKKISFNLKQDRFWSKFELIRLDILNGGKMYSFHNSPENLEVLKEVGKIMFEQYFGKPPFLFTFAYLSLNQEIQHY
jgi:hypothetical protein